MLFETACEKSGKKNAGNVENEVSYGIINMLCERNNWGLWHK